jgi:DNA (cytosine-5)-methyltransferase 1
VHRGELSLIAPASPEAAKPTAVEINGVNEPLGTITTKAEHLLIGAHVTKFRSGAVGSAANEPMPTVTGNSYIKQPGGAPPLGVVSAFLAKHYGGQETAGAELTLAFSTITARDHHALVTSHVLNLKGSDRRTHLAAVRAFLIKFCRRRGVCVRSDAHCHGR